MSAQRPRSEGVVWEPAKVVREQRWSAAGQRGATVWFTGLPAAGKSTLAAVLERDLLAQGRLAYRLDGDNLRHGLCGDLGFSPADRAENVRRTAHAACLLADAGVVAVVSLVSPYRRDRALARTLHEEHDLVFHEVHVATPLAVCEDRDPKGLYARARRGELSGMTGVDDPYEAPEAPEHRIDGAATPADALAPVLRSLVS